MPSIFSCVYYSLLCLHLGRVCFYNANNFIESLLQLLAKWLNFKYTAHLSTIFSLHELITWLSGNLLAFTVECILLHIWIREPTILFTGVFVRFFFWKEQSSLSSARYQHPHIELFSFFQFKIIIKIRISYSP